MGAGFATGDAAANVSSADIIDGTVVNADISASAAVAVSKLEALAAGSLIVGDGSGGPAEYAIGTVGKVLRSDGTNPIWSTATYPTTFVAGDLVVSTATNVVGVVTDVAIGRVLVSGGVGVVPAYSATPTLGVASATTGSLSLAHASSAYTTTFQPGVNITASRTYTWPVDIGSAGQVLTDAAGNGTLSWATPTVGAAFNTISSGTNTTATMAMGTGSSITLAGTATIGALLVTQLSSSGTTMHIGTGSGAALTNATNCTYYGNAAGSVNITATNQTFIGFEAGLKHTGADNTFVGANCGAQTTETASTDCTGVGSTALAGCNGSFHTAFGSHAGDTISTGATNACFGSYSGSNRIAGATAITSGGSNTMLGADAVTNSATASFRIAVGAQAMAQSDNQCVVGHTLTSFYINRPTVGVASLANVVFSINSPLGGTDTDTAGATWTYAGSRGTGTGAPGSHIFQTATTLGTGTTQQSLVTHMTLGGGAVTTGVAPITFAETHFVNTQATAPTTTLTSTTLNDGAGSGASITVTAGSTDTCGSITITAGNGVPTAGIAGQIVFFAAYAAAPKCVMLTPKDTDAVTNVPYISATAAGSFQVSFSVGMTASEVNEYYYLVIG